MGTQSSPLSPSSNGRVIKDDKNDRIYVTDTSNVPRVVLGSLPDGTQGMWVSKTGFDATKLATETANNLVFNSGQDVFKIVGVYQVTFSFTTGAGFTIENISIPHNLGYVPLVIPYVTSLILNPFVTSATSGQLPLTGYAGSSGVSGIVMNWYMAFTGADSSNLHFQAGIYTGSGNACSGVAKAYIVQETAN